MSKPIRILVAEDHPVVRDGLVAVLSTQSDFAVVGEAGNGAEVVQKAADLRPDMVLLDLEMPGMDGVEALHQMQTRSPKVRIIVFTSFDSDDRILAAVQAGVQGYILKGAPREQLFEALRVVHAGGSLLQPVVASKLLKQVSQRVGSSAGSQTMTRRESDVLGLLGEGLQNKEIAERLGIAERTVKFHVGSILRKLDVGNRTEAVATAIRKGLIKP